MFKSGKSGKQFATIARGEGLKIRTNMIILRPHMMNRVFYRVNMPVFGLALVSAVAVICFSCNSRSEKPAAVLDRDKMVAVLQDIYVAEEKIKRLILPGDSAAVVTEMFEARVFEAQGISDSVFQESLNYYMAHPKEFELIYVALVDSLQLKEERSRKK